MCAIHAVLGSASVVTKMQDLWIFSDAAQQALYKRALNNKGLELIKRYLVRDMCRWNVAAADKLYPQKSRC